MVKNLPAMQETGVQSLGQEAMEKAMTTHSSILAWRILWTEEPGYIYTMKYYSAIRKNVSESVLMRWSLSSVQLLSHVRLFATP